MEALNGERPTRKLARPAKNGAKASFVVSSRRTQRLVVHQRKLYEADWSPVPAQRKDTPKVRLMTHPSAERKSRLRGNRVSGCQLARFQNESDSEMLSGSRLSPAKAIVAATGHKASARLGDTKSQLTELTGWSRQNVKGMESVRSVKHVWLTRCQGKAGEGVTEMPATQKPLLLALHRNKTAT